MKTLKYSMLLIALFFAIPVGFCVAQYVQAFQKIDIVNNGKEAIATVTDYYSDTTINDEEFYYLKYTYEDGNGGIHSGRTSSVFTYEEAFEATTVKIKYSSNFKSIEANYTFSFKTEPAAIILTIFVGLDIAFWVVFICICVKDRRDAIIRKNGKEYVATFAGCGTNTYINGAPIFWIEYEYTNDEGIVVKNKTRSLYTDDEKNFFEKTQTFKIKTLKGKSVITEPIDISKTLTVAENTIEENKEVEEVRELTQQTTPAYKRCVFCGSIITHSDKRCPCCGSRKFEVDKKYTDLN